MNQGICYIVGAGPGDPGLLTVKGLDYLRRAEVLFYDHLVSAEILALAPPAAERVYVGKHRGQHAMDQEELCRRLCAAVRAGRVVVRLKGGDPYVLGRGGEEVAALKREGLPFEVVPGITAAIAAAASTGIPVTQRHLSTGVTLVTGHEAAGKYERDVDWRALARIGHTLCIYMGMKHLRRICAELIAGGRPADEPAAIVQWATLPAQRVVTGTLATLPDLAEQEQIGPPAIVIVGSVVSLREDCKYLHPTENAG